MYPARLARSALAKFGAEVRRLRTNFRKGSGRLRHPLAVRLRAAIEALRFEHPKLSAVAMGYMSRVDFASRLEQAIERSGRSRAPLLLPPPRVKVEPT